MDELLLQEVLFLQQLLKQVHQTLGTYRKDMKQPLHFLRTKPENLTTLYHHMLNQDPLNQYPFLIQLVNLLKNTTKILLQNPPQSTPSPLSLQQLFTNFQKYFQNLSVYLKNGSTESLILISDFFKMYCLFTKLSPSSEPYFEVLFSFLTKAQSYLPLSEFKHFLAALGLDIVQLQNIYQDYNKLIPIKAMNQDINNSPIFVIPSLIEYKQFVKYIKAINSSESHSKALAAFQQSFSLLKNHKSIFEQYTLLKRLMIDQQINSFRTFGEEVYIVSKKWYQSFLKVFSKIYDSKVLKAQKKQSKVNFIKVNTNKSPKKDKKQYSLTYIKSEEPTQSNLYVVLKSQTIDNDDIQGEYQLELRDQKNPQLNFKVLSSQIYQQIQAFIQYGKLNIQAFSKRENDKSYKKVTEYRRKVQQANQIEFYPVIITLAQSDQKGELNFETVKQILVSQKTTLKQLSDKQLSIKEFLSVSFFVKHFDQKNYREETNQNVKIKDLTTKNSKLIIAITSNRLGFIQANTRKEISKETLTIGDKLFAFSEKNDSLLLAYVIAKKPEKSQVKVHFIGKSWRQQTWVKIDSVHFSKQEFQDQKKRPQEYIQSYMGMLNVGNTCYINSSIQSLFSTQIFSTLLDNQPMNTKLFSYQLQLIFNHLSSSPSEVSKDALNPKPEVQFKRNMTQFFKQFAHWQQQDTQQFLHAVLDKVSQEQKMFIQKIFRFWIQNELICSSKTCTGRKVNKEAMTMITLPIPEPKQIYVQIILVPIYRDKLQKILIKLNQDATLKGQLLRKFQERSGLQSDRVIMIEIDNGVLKEVRPQLTHSLKNSDTVTLKQLGIVANYNLAAYEVIKEQKLQELIKKNSKTNSEKKIYFDFFIKETKTWTVAKVRNPNSSLIPVVYLDSGMTIRQTKIPKTQIQNKTYMFDTLGVKTLQTEKFHVKLFMRKLVQNPVTNGKIMENFGFPFLITLPIWCNYNDVLSIIYEQMENVLTKAEFNEHYTVRFMEPRRQKCVFCSNELSRLYNQSEDILKRCCKVLESDSPILFLINSKSFVIYMDWKNLNCYNSTFSSSLGMDRACKATEEEFKEQKVSLYECFNLLRIKQEVQMTCDTCKHPKMYRQESISTLPPILIIQLKEYRFLNQKEAMVKLNTNLRYEEVKKIDIEPYLAQNSLLKESQNYSSIYELYSVIQHVGSGNSGHYTAICKRKLPGSSQEVWVFFDDSYSQIIDQTHVQDYLNNAYMLFYRKQYLGIADRLKLGLI